MDSINLNGYKKAIFVYGMSETELLAKVKEYEEIASGGEARIVKLSYVSLSEDWIYMDFAYAEDFGDWNFWHYQNLLLWLADGNTKSFCFAYKELHTYEDAFYSCANKEDESGASVTGIFKGAEFYYEVPGFFIDWWTGEGVSPFGANKLYKYRGIDTAWLEDLDKREWKAVEIAVSD